MDTDIVTAELVALLLSEEDEHDPFLLLQHCLAEHGIPGWSSPMIRMFQRGRLRLLLACPSPPRRHRVPDCKPRIRRRS